MTDTPRTDALAAALLFGNATSSMFDHARELERELAAAQAAALHAQAHCLEAQQRAADLQLRFSDASSRAERMRQHILRKVVGRLCEPSGRVTGEWGCGMCGGVGKGPASGEYDPSTIKHEPDCMLVPLPEAPK